MPPFEQLVLGLESSCDETAAALVTGDGEIRASHIASQNKDHQPHGGVVPEIAARKHLERIETLTEKALAEAGAKLEDVTAIASTSGPGLIGGLMTGVMFGRALAKARNLPWLGINHLEGHALTARLTDKVEFPYLLLLVSGGHTQLLEVRGVGDYRRLGTTIDDAAGECFDKSAKLLGLGYPGGPALEKAAVGGNAKRYELPRPMLGRPGCDFSFSGLKTAVRHQLNARRSSSEAVGESIQKDMAASVEEAIASTLADRTKNAFGLLQARPTALVVSGGVAANQRVRTHLKTLAEKQGVPMVAPPVNLCGDNAAMIAWAAIERLKAGLGAEDDGHPRPRWPLDKTLAAA